MFDPNLIADDRVRAVYNHGQTQREKRIDARRKYPLIQLYDGDWNFQARIDPWVVEADFKWKLNDTGTCTVKIPTRGSKSIEQVASWLLNPWGRPRAKTVHLRCDKDGGRWTGKIASVRLTKEEDGSRSIVLEGLDDYEELKRIYCWPNPFLPASVQFPKAFMLIGRSDWILKVALLCNLIRLQGSLWRLPDDPLEWESWTDLAPHNWSIVVKPTDHLRNITPINLISSRMQTWHDMAAPVLADSQLMVKTRRWFTGDEQPWRGYTPRNGQLVVDIVDKSGWWDEYGTSIIGNRWNGVIRQVQALLGNNIDTESTIIDEPITVPEYQKPNWLGTRPNCPYVTYRDEDITGVESIDFTWQPATTVNVLTGGSSMPGTNELISASVQAAGNLVGSFLAVPTAGTIADTLLEPLYSDTLLAWMSVKSHNRANELGWSRYQEYFAEGANAALTLSSLVAIRKAFWDTRERFTHQLKLADGAPWFIGDEGQGHFWLGDRVATTVRELPDGKMVVEQVTELRLNLARGTFGWEATMGDYAATESSMDMVLRNINKVTGAIHDQGVW